MEPMVSVIIPAFNCETTIEQTLLSVLNQTVSSLEVIIIDDCSSDQTYQIVKEFSSAENRIRLYQNSRNCGVAKTRNIGCSHAIGKYIAFLDSDDVWEPDKLEKQLREMEETGSHICYTSYYTVSPRGRKLYRVPAATDYYSLLKENVIGCSTVMLYAEIIKKHKFDSTFFHEDYVLWLTLLRAGYRAVGVEEPLVCYRTGGRSSNKLTSARNRWMIYREFLQLPILEAMYYFLQYAIHSHNKYWNRH